MLNPKASEYIPVSRLTLHLPFRPHTLPSITLITSTVFPISPPPTILSDFPFPNFTIPLQAVTANCPPPLPDVSLTSDPEFVPFATREKKAPRFLPRVITHRKFIPRPCGRRRGRSCLTVDDKDRRGFGFRGDYCRKMKISESCDLKKHGIMPLKHDEEKTTIMIKNIPYDFTRLNLLEFLDKHCMAENQEAEERSSEEDGIFPSLSAYDFLYLPIDFEKKKNKGYAFVNFTESRAVWKFFHIFNATRWNFNNSPKIRRIVCARIQGKEALVKHFEKTYFECESDEFLPVCFSPPRDGSGASVELTTIGRRKGGHVSSGTTLNCSLPC